MKTATSNNKYVSGKLFYVSKYRMADKSKKDIALISFDLISKLNTSHYRNLKFHTWLSKMAERASPRQISAESVFSPGTSTSNSVR